MTKLTTIAAALINTVAVGAAFFLIGGTILLPATI